MLVFKRGVCAGCYIALFIDFLCKSQNVHSDPSCNPRSGNRSKIANVTISPPLLHSARFWFFKNDISSVRDLTVTYTMIISVKLSSWTISIKLGKLSPRDAIKVIQPSHVNVKNLTNRGDDISQKHTLQPHVDGFRTLKWLLICWTFQFQAFL